MSVTAINNTSNTYFQPATTNCTGKSSTNTSSTGSSSGTTPNQSFAQLMSAFQSDSTQNEGQSVDPLSMF
jgi:hypothetical protein